MNNTTTTTTIEPTQRSRFLSLDSLATRFSVLILSVLQTALTMNCLRLLICCLVSMTLISRIILTRDSM